MTYGTVNVDKVVNSDGVTSGGLYGFKNRIINGAMMIDQRNAGASTSFSGAYFLDRWRGSFSGTTTAAANIQQNAGSVTPPAGFTNYLGITVTATESISGSNSARLIQYIEGYNVADFGYGGSSASTITMSFWVRSSLTGTFGGVLRNSAGNRFYVFSYTISSANTWEQKTFTVTGDTSGTWLTNNGVGLAVWFNLGAGSTVQGAAGSWGSTTYEAPTGQTNLFGTNGATFYITGVQLEKGSTATSFDYRPYGTELALCQRYYYKVKAAGSLDAAAVGLCNTTTAARFFIPFVVSMRTNPTALEQTGTAANYNIQYLNTGASCSAVPTFFTATTEGAGIDTTLSAGLTAGQAAVFRIATNAYLAWSAEL